MTILIHQNLITYAHQNQSEGLVKLSHVVWYAVDFEQVMMRLRYGAFVHMVQRDFGPREAQCLVALLKVGKAQFKNKTFQRVIGSLPEESIKTCMQRLLDAQLIERVTPADQHTLSDVLLGQKAQDSRQFSAMNGGMPKMSSGVRSGAKKGDKSEMELEYDVQVGQKRKMDMVHEAHKLKKSRMNPVASSPSRNSSSSALGKTDESGVVALTEQGYYRVNVHKCNILLRNQLIARYAALRVHPSCGPIMQALLKSITPNLHHCALNPSETAADTFGMARITHLVPDTPLSLCSSAASTSSSHLSVSTARDRMTQLREFIISLCLDEAAFLHDTDMSRSTFSIPISPTLTHLRSQTIQSTLLDRFSPAALRIYRLLDQTRGPLDEKAVHKKCLLDLKQTRQWLFRLLQAGYVELQEVPRTADRAPSRTTYLYRVNPHVAASVVQGVYKSVFNLQQRARGESEQSAWLVQKAQRKDVREDPELLSVAERKALTKLASVRQYCVASQILLDRTLAILRDF